MRITDRQFNQMMALRGKCSARVAAEKIGLSKAAVQAHWAYKPPELTEQEKREREEFVRNCPLAKAYGYND